jgi:hypothetical protein
MIFRFTKKMNNNGHNTIVLSCRLAVALPAQTPAPNGSLLNPLSLPYPSLAKSDKDLARFQPSIPSKSILAILLAI